MANLKALFGNLLRKASGYTDDAARLASKYDDVILKTSKRAPDVSLDDLDDLAGFGKKPIEPVTIGNYINPNGSSLSLDQVRALDSAEAALPLKNLYSQLDNAYSDDALRLASNHGDDVSDLTRALAPGGSNAAGIINPYLGIPEETLSQLQIRDGTDRLYDSIASFRQNLNNRLQTNMPNLQTVSNYGDDAIGDLASDIDIFNNLRQNALDVPANLSNNTVDKLMSLSGRYGNPYGFEDWHAITSGTQTPFINDIVAHSGNKKLRNWLRNKSTPYSDGIMTPEWLDFLHEDIF